MTRNGLIGVAALLALFGLDVRAEPEEGKDAQGDPLPKGAVMRLGTRRFRHEGTAYAVAYAPDGSAVASCGSDGTIRLWDPGSGREIRRFEGHTAAVVSLAFLDDGKSLVSAAHDNTVRLWDVVSGAERAKLEATIYREGAVAASPDGRWVAAGGEGGTLLLWRHDGGGLNETRRAETTPVRSLAFSPDGQTLAVAGDPGHISLVHVADGRVIRTLPGHEQWTCKVAYSPDGRFLASAGRDARVRLWDIGTGKQIREFDGCDFVADGVCFSPDGMHVAASDYWGNVFVWEAASGARLVRFAGNSEWVKDLAFSPDSTTLAAASYDIRILDLGTGLPRLAFDGHREEVNALAFSPDGASLASGGGHSVIYVWSTRTGKPEHVFPYRGHRVCDLAYSPDGKSLAAAIMFFRLAIWDVANEQIVAGREGGDDHGWDGRLSFSADGKSLAWGGVRGALQIVNPRTGDEVRAFPAVEGLLHSLAFAGKPERLHVATSGGLFAFDVEQYSSFKVSAGYLEQAAWSADGRLVAAAGGLDKGIALRDARTGERARVIEDDGSYSQLRFSPDGSLLAGAGVRIKTTRVEEPDGTITTTTSHGDGIARVWDVTTGVQVAEIAAHAGRVRCVAISPDGRLLATGGVDTTVLLWDLARLRRK